MYTFFYACACILLPIVGWQIKKIGGRPSGIFLLNFTISFSLWLILYFLFFADFIHSESILLYLSRINFILGIFGVYNLLFFLYYYHSYSQRMIPQKMKLTIQVTLSSLIYLYICTPYVIAGLTWDRDVGVFREIPGPLYSLTGIFYLTFLIAFLTLGVIQVKKQTGLEKIRLQRILIGAYSMMFILLLLQVALPFFHIWILEQQIIILPIAFIVYVYALLRRYYFSPLGYGIGKVIVFLVSLFLAVLFHITLTLYLSSTSTGSFWSMYDPFHVGNTIGAICLFYSSYYFLSFKFIGSGLTESIKHDLLSVQSEISQTSNYAEMNHCLNGSIKKLIHSTSCSVIIFNESNIKEYLYTQQYFEAGLQDNLYIHDLVFQEERGRYYDMRLFEKEIPKDAFLLFPLMENKNCIGIFVLGRKHFKDFYSQDQIHLLKKFSYFLSSHIRYIKTYQGLQELTNVLDRRVDEKTMEYNHLLSRQKEFISIVSHEVRSPLSSLLFQADSIVSDLKRGVRITKKKLLEEIEILQTQLIRTSSLVAKIFAVEYHDTQQVSLFREHIPFTSYIAYELDLFQKVHPDVTILRDIDEVGFIDIDRVQFQQVITNLLENALKFQSDTPLILSISIQKKDHIMTMSIEDNGAGFGDIDMHILFDKYTVGSKNNIGLGMGLYLCKKIISLHGGTIEAALGEKYGGALFVINLNTPS